MQAKPQPAGNRNGSAREPGNYPRLAPGISGNRKYTRFRRGHYKCALLSFPGESEDMLTARQVISPAI